MMKRPTIVLLALLSVLAAGCAAWRAEKAEESAPTANLAGTWTGSAGTGGVFVPVSLTLNSTPCSTGTNRTVMPPSNVNLKALDRRFRTTFSHISVST